MPTTLTKEIEIKARHSGSNPGSNKPLPNKPDPWKISEHTQGNPTHSPIAHTEYTLLLYNKVLLNT